MSTFSEIKITFSQDLPVGAQLGFDVTNNGGSFGIPTSYAQVFNWVNSRTTNHQVSVASPTGIAGEATAINFVTSFNLDVAGFTVSRVDNAVTIKIENLLSITEFYVNGSLATYTNDPSIIFDIHNQTSAFRFDSIVLSEATLPCDNIKITAQTNVLADSISSPFVVNPNTQNPIVFETSRGSNILLEVTNNTLGTISQTVVVPSSLSVLNFSIAPLITPNGANITISNINTFGLDIEYSLDGLAWQFLNSFSGLDDGTYVLYVRDNFGCSFQKTFVVNSASAFVPFFYISKSNSIRFAKRVDFNTTYKNDENTLSCEVDVRLPKCETQLYQTNDIIQNQFKSNYLLNVVKIIKEDLTEIVIPVVQKTNNLNQKDKRDANIVASGYKTHIYFTSGNVYDYTTNAITGAYNLNGSVPDWAVVGNFIIVNGGTHLIEDVIFDEILNADVIVFDGIYLDPTAQAIVSTIYNIEEYEVYEFDIDMLPFLNQNIKVQITSSKTGYPDLIYLSERINVQIIQLNTIEIKYRNSTNTDVFFSTNIEFKIRQKFIFQNGINDQASEKYKTDTNVVLLSSDIYEGDEFVFEPVTKELMRKIIAALSHDIVFINDIGYVKNDAVEFEGPLNDTNWYAIKAKMLKNGDVYPDPLFVPPLIATNKLTITALENTTGTSYEVGFIANFALSNLYSEVSLDGLTWSTPVLLSGISSPKNLNITESAPFYVRLSDVSGGQTTYSNAFNFSGNPIILPYQIAFSDGTTADKISHAVPFVINANLTNPNSGSSAAQVEISIDLGVTWVLAYSITTTTGFGDTINTMNFEEWIRVKSTDSSGNDIFSNILKARTTP